MCGGALAAILVAIVGRDYPLVGHDLRYYIPRLLDTDIHLRLNGPAVQWYTPSFGGGLPAFANPQHLQYSALQAFTYFVDPWVSFQLTTAAITLLGFLVFHRFLRTRLKLHLLTSVLGAVFLIGNGFYIEHLIVGHVGFQLFPLVAVMLFALTCPNRRVIVCASLIALCVAAMMFQAGVYLIILLGLSLAVSLPVLYLVKPDVVDLRRLTSIAAVALGLSLAMVGSRIYATLAFMRQFPREVADIYDVGLAQALVGFAAQLIGLMPLAPIFALMGADVTLLSTALLKLTGASVQVGVWELDTGLSPVLTACLCLGLLGGIAKVRGGTLPRLDRGQIAALIMVLVMSWIFVEATLARGFVYPVVKGLPVLRSLHVNHRIAAVFILPLTIVGVAILDRWYVRTQRSRVVATMLCAALVAPLSFWLLPARVHLKSFDVTQSVADAQRIRSGDPLIVTRIADVEDAEALSLGASSYRPYEPMFGYGLATFAAETRLGDVRAMSSGYFNMTNPASLVFPALNQVRPFERIPVEDRDNLDRFVARGQPAWHVPATQHRLNWLACLALTFTVGVLLAALVKLAR